MPDPTSESRIANLGYFQSRSLARISKEARGIKAMPEQALGNFTLVRATRDGADELPQSVTIHTEKHTDTGAFVRDLTIAWAEGDQHLESLRLSQGFKPTDSAPLLTTYEAGGVNNPRFMLPMLRSARKLVEQVHLAQQ